MDRVGEERKGCVGGGFRVAMAQASLWKGGGAESAPAVAGVFGRLLVPEGTGGRAGRRGRGGADFGPVAFERILGRRKVAKGRPCAVMPLGPEPVPQRETLGEREIKLRV